MNGAPRFHLCMSGDPSCSGCNPCEPCAEFVSKTVNGPLLSAMVAAGFNGSYEQSMAFFRGYTEGWQRLGHAMAVDPNIRSRLRATNVGAMIDSLAALGQMGGAPGQQALPFSPGVVQPPAIFGMPQPQPQFGPPPGFGAPQGLPPGFQPMPPAQPPQQMVAGPNGEPLVPTRQPDGSVSTVDPSTGAPGPSYVPGAGWTAPRLPAPPPQAGPGVPPAAARSFSDAPIVPPPGLAPTEPAPPAPTSSEDVRRSIGERRDAIDATRLEGLVQPAPPPAAGPLTPAEIAQAISPAETLPDGAG